MSGVEGTDPEGGGQLKKAERGRVGRYGGARLPKMMHRGERAALHAALVALAVAVGVAGALAAAEAAAEEMPEPLRRLQQVQMNLWQRACGTAALNEGIGCWWNNYGWGAILDSFGF